MVRYNIHCVRYNIHCVRYNIHCVRYNIHCVRYTSSTEVVTDGVTKCYIDTCESCHGFCAFTAFNAFMFSCLFKGLKGAA